MRRLLRAIVLGPLAAWFIAPASASADCQPAGSIDQELVDAPIAFVGTAVEVVGSMARFEVHEVWSGTVAGQVEVHGLTSGVEFSEDDRRWEAGTRYLVVPIIEGAVLRDSICTATTEWRAELEALRPATAEVVDGQQAGGVSVPSALVLVGAVVLLVGGVSLLAFRRR